MTDPKGPIEFDFEGSINGIEFKRVKILPKAYRKFGEKKQPPLSELRDIFCRDLLPTFSMYKMAVEYDEKYNEKVFHAVSCTAGKIGFSTEYRDTISKIEDSVLIVPHHNILKKKQYEREMNNYYPEGLEPWPETSSSGQQ